MRPEQVASHGVESLQKELPWLLVPPMEFFQNVLQQRIDLLFRKRGQASDDVKLPIIARRFKGTEDDAPVVR
jgi:hypothetical protein